MRGVGFRCGLRGETREPRERRERRETDHEHPDFCGETSYEHSDARGGVGSDPMEARGWGTRANRIPNENLDSN